MAEADIEAKKLHTKKVEELLVGPVFDIFHVQRAQLAEKTESQNSLLFHFKASMAKVRTWNASTVKSFVSNLVSRFPVLGEEFDSAFDELLQVTCKVLNASSNINQYDPLTESSHTYLHELISACADSFISFPEWFAVDPESAEYQTCKNNAKVRMAQSGVVPNTVMNFIKTSRREPNEDMVQDEAHENSDMDLFEGDVASESEASDVSSLRGPKKINVKSGLVTQEPADVDDTVDADVVSSPPPQAQPDSHAGASALLEAQQASQAPPEQGDDQVLGQQQHEDSSNDGDMWDESTAEADSGADFSDIDIGSSEMESDDTGSEDTCSEDIDMGSADSGSEDTGSEYTGSEDTGSEDTGSDNTGSDMGSEYTGSECNGSEDTGSEYTGSSDMGSEETSSDLCSEDTGSDTSSDVNSTQTQHRYIDESASTDESSEYNGSSSEYETATSLQWESVSDGSHYTVEGWESE